MRIAFDGTTLRPSRTGVGYYSEHLLSHLAEEARDDEIVVVSNRPVETTRPLPRRVRVVVSKSQLPSLVWMNTSALRMLEALQVDVAHFTNGMLPILTSRQMVVTIHDMSLTLYPRCHPPRRVILNRPLVDLAARRASAVITVSESAKRDIVRLRKVPPERVHVIHEAAAPSFRRIVDPRELDRVRRRYGIGDRAILCVGTIEPRKNLPRLIEAFAERRRSGDLPHQLVCIGPYGWLSRGITSLVERLNIADAVVFTGYVPFDDLPALYSLAEMFVFPSLYEGFGLPVIEAMACGTPVISGRAAALTEVANGAVEHVNELDVGCLGEAMVSLARCRDRREQLSALGIARAKMFTWTRAARETLGIYRQAARCASPAAIGEPVPAFADIGDPSATPSTSRDTRQPWTQ